MGTGLLVDGLRLSVGTLTVVPVPPPRRVGPGTAAVAMLAAVLPGASIGLAAGLVVVGAAVGLPPLVAGAAAVAVGALATRVLHLDGLADTADGLTVPGSRERALEVMHRGDVGPAGAVALLLVLLAQVGALAALAASGRPWWVVLGLVTLAWASSRAVLPLLTVRGTVAARSGGLGAVVVGTVPRPLAGLPLLALAVAASGGGAQAVAAVAAGALTAVLLARGAHQRLGGLSGDVLGACVEVALCASLVVLSLGSTA